MKKYSAKRAYTLLELLIVLSLCILMVSITIPRHRFVRKIVLENEIETLRAICTYLQQKSIASHQQHKLIFVSNTGVYHYQTGNKTVTHKLSHHIKFGFIPNSIGPPSRETKPITDAITFAHHKILFYPNGKISPGTVYLTDQQNRWMSALTVSVGQVSFLRRYNYVNHRPVLVHCPYAKSNSKAIPRPRLRNHSHNLDTPKQP